MKLRTAAACFSILASQLAVANDAASLTSVKCDINYRSHIGEKAKGSVPGINLSEANPKYIDFLGTQFKGEYADQISPLNVNMYFDAGNSMLSGQVVAISPNPGNNRGVSTFIVPLVKNKQTQISVGDMRSQAFSDGDFYNSALTITCTGN